MFMKKMTFNLRLRFVKHKTFVVVNILLFYFSKCSVNIDPVSIL